MYAVRTQISSAYDNKNSCYTCRMLREML